MSIDEVFQIGREYVKIYKKNVTRNIAIAAQMSFMMTFRCKVDTRFAANPRTHIPMLKDAIRQARLKNERTEDDRKTKGEAVCFRIA